MKLFLVRERAHERWRRGGVRGANRERHSEDLMGSKSRVI